MAVAAGPSPSTPVSKLVNKFGHDCVRTKAADAGDRKVVRRAGSTGDRNCEMRIELAPAEVSYWEVRKSRGAARGCPIEIRNVRLPFVQLFLSKLAPGCQAGEFEGPPISLPRVLWILQSATLAV